MVLSWLPYLAPDVIESLLRLVSPVSTYCYCILHFTSLHSGVALSLQSSINTLHCTQVLPFHCRMQSSINTLHCTQVLPFHCRMQSPINTLRTSCSCRSYQTVCLQPSTRPIHVVHIRLCLSNPPHVLFMSFISHCVFPTLRTSCSCRSYQTVCLQPSTRPIHVVHIRLCLSNPPHVLFMSFISHCVFPTLRTSCSCRSYQTVCFQGHIKVRFHLACLLLRLCQSFSCTSRLCVVEIA